MILYFYSEEELGLYSVGYNLPMHISDVVTFALSYSIVPLYVKIYTREGRKETEDFLKDSFKYVLIGIIPICFGYYAVSKELIICLASEKYAGAVTFSYMILLGSMLIGLSNVLNAGLYLRKKVSIMFFINMIAVIINILLNLILLPKYGVTGAAVSTLLASIALIILTTIISFKYIMVRINIKSVLLNKDYQF
jgi:O-antigen/teichoic acid export membrane protein